MMLEILLGKLSKNSKSFKTSSAGFVKREVRNVDAFSWHYEFATQRT